jgi:hypothetical protein
LRFFAAPYCIPAKRVRPLLVPVVVSQESKEVYINFSGAANSQGVVRVRLARAVWAGPVG